MRRRALPMHNMIKTKYNCTLLIFLRRVMLSLLNASVLISALVMSPTAAGRWSEPSSRSSNLGTPSRCRPTCLVSRERSYPRPARHRGCCALLDRLVQLCSPILSFAPGIQLFCHCLFQDLHALEHVRCLMGPSKNTFHHKEKQRRSYPATTTHTYTCSARNQRLKKSSQSTTVTESTSHATRRQGKNKKKKRANKGKHNGREKRRKTSGNQELVKQT